jgi:hypothetical protein
MRVVDNPSYPKSAAYHEAGHIVIAVVQGLRLLKYGMHVDPHDGRGMSRYECRKPRDSRGVDSLGERTVISLFAGLHAQQKFCREATAANASRDKEHIDGVLMDMYIPESFPGADAFKAADCELQNARQRLKVEAEHLVSEHWIAIQALANHLWDQPDTPKDAHEEHWSTSPMEKKLCGEAICTFLEGQRIHASMAAG